MADRPKAMTQLSVEQIEQARQKILQNATELIEESELLAASGRFARAYSLAHLACEEMAKLPMLIRAATDKVRGYAVDWKKLDRRLRSHSEKITGILHIDYLLDPHIENDEDLKGLEKALKKVKDFNALKNQSLYTTQVGSSFQNPSEAISAELAFGLVVLARSRLAFFQLVEIPTQGKLKDIAKSSEFRNLSSALDSALKKRKRAG